MKKKPERYSFKKLTPANKKLQSKVNEELKQIYDNHRSHSKNKSAQKVLTVYESTNSKFKIGKIGTHDRHRIKTQIDEQNPYKNPYQKILTMRKKQKDQKPMMLQAQKSRIPIQTKQRTFKKLHLNSQLFQSIKKNSLQKNDHLNTGKHYSFRKAHESHRSGTKKTALQRYISQSLQNLDYPNKKKSSKLLKKTEQEFVSKQTKKHVYRDRQTYQHETKQQQKTGKYFQQKQKQKQKQSFRKLKTQKDDSLQKIQIKWQKKKKNPYDLSAQQQQTFGDRFPDGFDKVKLLGRGGFSLVWLGQHKKSKKKYAVKQIITQSSHQTHIKQIWFGTYFFEFGGAPKEQFMDSPGIKNLVKLYYYFINKKDTWILYQKCGDSLGNTLYELKGQHYNGQKVYRIHYKQFYHKIKRNQNQLKKVILEVAKALQLLSQNNIVHSDLKTENILIRPKTQDQLNTLGSTPQTQSTIAEVKLIDYGSSFVFNNLRQFSMATPEYMAPQILNFILYENQLEYIPKLFDYVQQYNNPWVIDVWSLGSVVLQIISGIPLWMSLKTVVKKKSQQMIKYGLFAIKGRTFDKIIKRQLQVVQNLDHYLYQENFSDIVLQQDLKVLLKRMLCLNPAKRISPSQIIAYLSKPQKG